jgi:hypothetical protein
MEGGAAVIPPPAAAPVGYYCTNIHQLLRLSFCPFRQEVLLGYAMLYCTVLYRPPLVSRH